MERMKRDMPPAIPRHARSSRQFVPDDHSLSPIVDSGERTVLSSSPSPDTLSAMTCSRALGLEASAREALALSPITLRLSRVVHALAPDFHALSPASGSGQKAFPVVRTDA